jgi:hypothetical protein
VPTKRYEIQIKSGYPPPPTRAAYRKRLPHRALNDIGRIIKPGQYVENLSPGSAGRLRAFVEERGLIGIQRLPQGGNRASVYVVTPAWVAKHPEMNPSRRGGVQTYAKLTAS